MKNSTPKLHPSRVVPELTLPHLRKTSKSLFGRFTALAVALSLLGAGMSARAVPAIIDNFDGYANSATFVANGWILLSLNPGLVATTFPAFGAGKSIRLQANPVAPTTAPAVVGWYKTNDYSNFYVQCDIASWPGTDKNQAIVLEAQAVDGTTGTVLPNQAVANGRSMICNYDCSQYGEHATDRRQGQFQMNAVRPGFSTTTIVAADITFVPGRPYRLTFSGVTNDGLGSFHYKCQAFDWNDLSKPLVTMENDYSDGSGSNYTHGACGIIGFQRQGSPYTGQTVDFQLDNFYAGETDPNLATPPALNHPIPDTPTIDTIIPANRWSNFLAPSSVISFTAKTYSANTIDTSLTKLYLNGVDVSASLVQAGNGTPSISGSLPGTVLKSNTLYTAELVVAETGGVKKSTNSFYFDTFSDAYLLTSDVKVTEAEEYNYSNGVYQLDPIPVSGLDQTSVQVNGFGVGYFDLMGTAEVDYHDNRGSSPESPYNQFRSLDAPGSLNGGVLNYADGTHAVACCSASDNVRSPHSASNLLEYVILRTEVGEWMNYTRSFDTAFYRAYLRYSSMGATSNELHAVTSDPTVGGQTTSKLGTFRIPNNITYDNYLYTPLVDDNGNAVLLNFSGISTFRELMTGTVGQDTRKIFLNYIMFVKSPVTLYSSPTVDGTYLLEAGATVNAANRSITVATSGDVRFYRVCTMAPVTIDKGSISISGGNITMKLQ